MLPEKTYFESLGYYLTDQVEEADHDQHYSPEIEAKKLEALVECQKAKPRYLSKLLELVKKYPQVPAFRNYLSVYYQLRKKWDKAFKVNQRLVKDFPDYIHGRINLAVAYIAEEQYEKVPELLGETLKLQDLYPNRAVFHTSEFGGYMSVTCQYLLATEQLEAAEQRLDLLEEILPDSEHIPPFRADLMLQRMNRTLAQISAQEVRRAEKQIDRGYDRSIQTEEMPRFRHQEILVLYENGLDIPPAELRKILALPRAGLVEDLADVLWDSVRRYEYFQTISEEDYQRDQPSFPLHALFLLTELRNCRSCWIACVRETITWTFGTVITFLKPGGNLFID